MNALRDLLSLSAGQVPRRGGLRLSSVGWGARRRIRWALVRGTALERPEKARVAVAVARRRQAALRQLPRLGYVFLVGVCLVLLAFGVAAILDAEPLRGWASLAIGLVAGGLGLQTERSRTVLVRAEARNAEVAARAGPTVVAPETLAEPTPRQLRSAFALGILVYSATFCAITLPLRDDDRTFVFDSLVPALTAGVISTALALTLGLSRSRRAWAETSEPERR